MAFTNFKAELSLPSVIINMPELQRKAARKKVFHSLLITLACMVFLGLCGLIYLELTVRPRETVNADSLEVKAAAGSVKLTIKMVPENVAGAVVEVDGEVVSGNPPYLYVLPSDEYHAIRIRAPGYRNMNKDVQLNAPEVVSFTLIPAVSPDGGDNQAIAEEEFAEMMYENDADSEVIGENSDDLVEEIENTAAISASDSGNGAKHKNREKDKDKEKGHAAGKVHPVQKAAPVTVSTALPVKTTPEPVSLTGNAVSPIPATPVPSTPVTSTKSLESPYDDNNTATAENDGESAHSPIPSTQLYRPPRASLIINAPLGIPNRVAVSVDGQMRGYLPVLLKVDAGLHELTFVYEGHRTFQMVKLNAGQIVRIVPKL